MLNDASLTIGYWLADSEQYADASGRPFQPHPTDGQKVTSIRRAAEPVAVIVHDRIRTDAEHLGRALGPAARMAIDNERLARPGSHSSEPALVPLPDRGGRR